MMSWPWNHLFYYEKHMSGNEIKDDCKPELSYSNLFLMERRSYSNFAYFCVFP